MLDLFKNTLIAYKGGGYDGCFWESNFAAVIEQKFYNLYSSGKFGADTLEKLYERMQDDWYDTYDLDNQEDLLRFQVNQRYDELIRVANKLSDIDITELDAEYTFTLPFVCTDCGQERESAAHNWAIGVGTQGLGGVVTGYTNLVCDQCYASYSCSYCGEYHDANQREYDATIEKFGYCEYCALEYSGEVFQLFSVYLSNNTYEHANWDETIFYSPEYHTVIIIQEDRFTYRYANKKEVELYQEQLSENSPLKSDEENWLDQYEHMLKYSNTLHVSDYPWALTELAEELYSEGLFPTDTEFFETL